MDLNWAGSQQQWAHVQVGKGQFLTTGVIPMASQVKHEPIPTPATAVQLIGGIVLRDISGVPLFFLHVNLYNFLAETANGNSLTEGSNAGESSPISYTTLSLVSQDPPQQNETRTELESVNGDQVCESRFPLLY